MTASTETLIRELAADLQPVRRLPSLHLRLAIWLAVCVSWVGAFVLLKGPSPGLAAQFSNPWWLIEQCAALVTAVAAGMAALSSAIPGRARWETLLPIIPLMVWVGALIHGCILERHSGTPSHFHQDWFCVAAILVMSAVPAIVLIRMVRRGLPRTPMATAALVVMAAGGPAQVALRLFYQQGSSLMILVWQVGTIAGLMMVAGLLGHKLLPEPRSKIPNTLMRA